MFVESLSFVNEKCENFRKLGNVKVWQKNREKIMRKTRKLCERNRKFAKKYGPFKRAFLYLTGSWLAGLG